MWSKLPPWPTREPVVHCDLTSRNKIPDFGVARVVPCKQLENVLKLTKVPGNSLFMPPECFSDDPVYDVTLDMFSYGVLILLSTRHGLK